jgi:L-amino acid N-acyltransferase YncA
VLAGLVNVATVAAGVVLGFAMFDEYIDSSDYLWAIELPLYVGVDGELSFF